MKSLHPFIRKVKWWLEWLGHSWPTWEEVWWPVRETWWAFRAALKGWSADRDYRRLWLSLPALLAGVLWLVLAVLLLAWTQEGIQTQYTRAATRALAARRYEEASLAFERLLETDRKSDPSHIFGLASSLQGLGQGEEAAALLAGIAPLNAPGYVPAHLVLAQSILGGAQPEPELAPVGRVASEVGAAGGAEPCRGAAAARRALLPDRPMGAGLGATDESLSGAQGGGVAAVARCNRAGRRGSRP